ncbi:hypothetical protein H0A36_24110 [Endozoicomonas sp. SM1973]|uniref:Uncharacterized protein n=1 Tax=Spartinivicinus marinus TaxID=2994442 RepID=A0A853I8E8_9GAMM|nr:phage tail tube protein [Spartinivicinus marinus]NYZ69109.1 hypothetical protein [Spartinivicinus marinus]
MADGSRFSFSYCSEDSYGVIADSPEFQTINTAGVSIKPAKETQTSNIIRSDRQIADLYYGTESLSGDIKLELRSHELDDFFEYIFCGEWIKDTPEAGVNELRVGQTKRSCTCVGHFSDMAEKPYHIYTGIAFNSLSFTISPEAKIDATLNVIGQKVTLSQELPDNSKVKAPQNGKPLSLFRGYVRESGADLGIVTEISLEITNGLEARHHLMSKHTLQPSMQNSQVTGTVNVYFESPTYLEKFLNEQSSSLEFTITDSADVEYTFVLPRILYTGADLEVSGPGSILLPLPFQAVLDPTTNTNLILRKKGA